MASRKVIVLSDSDGDDGNVNDPFVASKKAPARTATGASNPKPSKPSWRDQIISDRKRFESIAADAESAEHSSAESERVPPPMATFLPTQKRAAVSHALPLIVHSGHRDDSLKFATRLSASSPSSAPSTFAMAAARNQVALPAVTASQSRSVAASDADADDIIDPMEFEGLEDYFTDDVFASTNVPAHAFVPSQQAKAVSPALPLSSSTHASSKAAVAQRRPALAFTTETSSLGPRSSSPSLAAALARSGSSTALAAATDGRTKASAKRASASARSTRRSDSGTVSLFDTGAHDESASVADLVTSEMWADVFAPRVEGDLCLHARKVTEVREWLHSNLALLQQHQQQQQQRSHAHLPTAQRLLVLTGPAGCGKSSLIRALCASPSLGCVDNGLVGASASGGGTAAGESELRIITWHDVPELEYSATRRAGRASDDVFIEYQSKLAQLRAFLLRTQRYGSLSLVASSSSSSSSSSQASASPPMQPRQIIVLDDLPFLGRPELQAEFNDILLRVLPSSVHLMVVLYTEEHESSGGIWRVLDARLQNSPLVSHIRCNPVHATAMRTALQKIIRTVQSVATRANSSSSSGASSSMSKPKSKTSRAKRVKANDSSHPICIDDIEEEDRADADEDVVDFEDDSVLPSSSMDTGGNSADRMAVLRRMATAAQRLGDARLGEIVDASGGDLRSAINALQFELGGGGGSSSRRASTAHAASGRAATAAASAATAADTSFPVCSTSAADALRSEWQRSAGGSAKGGVSLMDDDSHDAFKQAGLSAGRDDQFSLFHCVGKILHAKGTQTPEFIIDRCEGTPAALFDFLFENYLDFMPDADVDCSAAAAEANSSTSVSSAFSVIDIGIESLTAFETLSEAMSSADMMRSAANTDYSNPHRLADESACLLACRAYLSTRTAALERLRALSRGAYSAPRARFASLYKPAAFDARRTRRDVRDRCALVFRPDLYAIAGAGAGAGGGMPRSTVGGTSGTVQGQGAHTHGDLAAEPSAASVAIATWASAVAPASSLDYLPIAALMVRRRAANQHAARLSQRLTPAQCQFLQDVCSASRFGGALSAVGRESGSARPPFRTMKSIRQRSRALNEHRGLDDAADVDESCAESRGAIAPPGADGEHFSHTRDLQLSDAIGANHATIYGSSTIASIDSIEDDIEDV